VQAIGQRRIEVHPGVDAVGIHRLPPTEATVEGRPVGERAIAPEYSGGPTPSGTELLRAELIGRYRTLADWTAFDGSFRGGNR